MKKAISFAVLIFIILLSLLLLFVSCLSTNPVDQISEKESGLKDTQNMLIVTTPRFQSSLSEYLSWKKARGMSVEVDIESAGKGSDAIRNKILQKYMNDGLRYIVLIGDIDDVPSIMIDGAPSDPSYTLLEGNDLVGDALISRISVNTVDELKNQLHKILVYEKGEFTSTDWIRHAVVASMDGFDGIAHAAAVEKGLKDHPECFSDVVKIMESDGNITVKLRNAIEVFGTNILAHHGHGSPDRFGSLPFTATDAKNLKNTSNGFPMIHGAACLTGSFHFTGGDCLAEAFMKAGTVEHPAGAIAFLGGSTSMDPGACIMAQKEVFIHQFFNDSVKTIGELFYRGTLHAIRNLSGERGEHLYRRWHLFGDCSTPIWRKAPAKK
jgi:hypothetical protein